MKQLDLVNGSPTAGRVTKQAILYVAHGSRVPEAVAETRAFVEKVMPRFAPAIQVVCFLELASPSIEEGIALCVEKGATHIAVVPILLLEAGHAKSDIPKGLQEAQRHFPHIRLSYGRPFGVQDGIVDALAARIGEQATLTEQDRILIVGRGSSDPDIPIEFEKIKERLRRKVKVAAISHCFLAAAQPDLPTGLEREIQSGAGRVFVVPYLLFTGILMQSIDKSIQKIHSPQQEFIVCKQLGFHESVLDVMAERVDELLDRRVQAK